MFVNYETPANQVETLPLYDPYFSHDSSIHYRTGVQNSELLNAVGVLRYVARRLHSPQTRKRSVLIRRSLIICLATAALLTNCIAAEIGDAVRSAIAQVSPSVVRIQIVGAPDRTGKIASQVTTGIVVSDDGEVVSSSFGFGGEIVAVFITTDHGGRHAAEVVATDHVRKVVLLKTSAEKMPLPRWAENGPAVGAWAIAAGRFYSASTPSAALGVVSAVDRVHGLAIQTDAKVSPVNYGGPLIGMDGSVYGILVPLAPGNEATGITAGVEWYDSGIGFAVPADDVLESVVKLRAGLDRKHGFLGIGLTTQNPLSPDVEVKVVHPGSPAEQGGIKVGDKVVSVNGHPIERMGNFQGVVKSSWAGDVLTVVLRNGNSERQVQATLTDELVVPERGWLGIVSVVNSSVDEAEDQGVLVGILDGSPAAEAGLSNPCWISKVDGVAVRTVRQLRGALRDLSVGDVRGFAFSLPDGLNQQQTVSVVAGGRSSDDEDDLISQVAAIRESFTAQVKPPEWRQSVVDLKEDRFAWVFGPAEKSTDAELGVVVVLDDGLPVTDTLVQGWGDVCRQHHLVLVVVYHQYAIPLDSADTLGLVMTEVKKLGVIDADRVTLVTEESHAGLVTRLLLNPRIRALGQAVFVGCRPLVAGLSLVGIQSKNPSLLLFPSTGGSQAQALLKSTVKTLRGAGAAVSLSQTPADVYGTQQASEIARWMLLQTIR